MSQVESGNVARPFQPLRGLRILDCGTYLAAPLSAQILSDMGAEVIKVVGPRGDPFRDFGYKRDGIGASWLTVNHGKDIVPLDLKTPVGREEFLLLVEGADAVVRNWRREVCERLSLEGSVLQARNPQLVVVDIVGYKKTDAERDIPTFDSIVQAQSGLTALSLASGAPAGLPVNLVDKCTGLYAANVLTSALLARVTDGVAPPPIVVPMIDVACHFNFSDTYQHMVHTDRERHWLPPANILIPCLDGTIVLSPPNRHELKKVAQALDDDSLLSMLNDSTGYNPADLLRNCGERIRQRLAGSSVDDALSLLARHDISAARVQDAHEFLKWDGNRKEPSVIREKHPAGWEYLTPTYPAFHE